MAEFQEDNYTLKNKNFGGQEITFYRLSKDGNEFDGATVESVIDLALERIRELNEKFSCRENAVAITKLQEARMWLDERTKDRVKRGVEGKHEE